MLRPIIIFSLSIRKLTLRPDVFCLSSCAVKSAAILQPPPPVYLYCSLIRNSASVLSCAEARRPARLPLTHNLVYAQMRGFFFLLLVSLGQESRVSPRPKGGCYVLSAQEDRPLSPRSRSDCVPSRKTAPRGSASRGAGEPLVPRYLSMGGTDHPNRRPYVVEPCEHELGRIKPRYRYVGQGGRWGISRSGGK
jgi:hypothetical protein